jgi:hypothetical protein
MVPDALQTNVPPLPSRDRSIGALLVLGIADLVFWRTAYPTINWWDSAQYSLAAGTLGVAGPPGSLLLTLVGWPVAQLPIGSSPAHALNIVAGTLAALAAVFVYAIALRLMRFTGPPARNGMRPRATALGAALGALTFAFSPTLWEYAVQFTPYVLSAVFTALILWTMLRWWEDADDPQAWRWLAALGLLFGLDYSVHRTNALLLPGALAWIVLRRARARSGVLAGAVGLLVGLAAQLLIIPIAIGAMERSPLFWNDPTNWSRFWDYTSLSRLGGGFLIQFFPRKADFWSVQVADVLHVLGNNFLVWRGPLSVLGALPAAAGLLGLVTLWRRDRRLAIAYTIVLLLQASITVLFFNIPANFFRTFDRHYLPICLTIGVLIAYGLATALQVVAELSLKRLWRVAVPAGMLALFAPVAQVINSWQAHDASRRYFTKQFATNLLTSLPPNAILFTAGDNDTFPLLYFQAVEGVRQDVTIINLSVANLPAFAEELLHRDPTFPLSFSEAERAALSAPGATPQAITIPVVGTAEALGLGAGAKRPGAITVTVKPQYGSRLLPAEVTLLDIVRTNAWRRPLCFAITGSRNMMAGFAPYGRLEGLYWRVVPLADPPADVRLVRQSIIENADYGGYADPAVPLDNESRRLGLQSYTALGGLLEAERKSGDIKGCQADAAALVAALPPDRLGLPPDERAKLASQCAPSK